MLTWPAFKACEPHVVLIALTALAGLALIAPGAWLAFWRWGVRGMAMLAPTLAVARITNAVATGAVEGEFARWFRPDRSTSSRERSERLAPSPLVGEGRGEGTGGVESTVERPRLHRPDH